jgi:hypothetical protein
MPAKQGQLEDTSAAASEARRRFENGMMFVETMVFKSTATQKRCHGHRTPRRKRL